MKEGKKSPALTDRKSGPVAVLIATILIEQCKGNMSVSTSCPQCEPNIPVGSHK